MVGLHVFICISTFLPVVFIVPLPFSLPQEHKSKPLCLAQLQDKELSLCVPMRNLESKRVNLNPLNCSTLISSPIQCSPASSLSHRHMVCGQCGNQWQATECTWAQTWQPLLKMKRILFPANVIWCGMVAAPWRRGWEGDAGGRGRPGSVDVTSPAGVWHHRSRDRKWGS